MQTLAEIKEMLAVRGFSPRKAFGQNFLIDHNLIRKLVDESGAGAGDIILEVGPGTGTMTEELLARGCTVIAAEIDRGLSNMLRERFGPAGDQFRLVEGDCLDGKRSLSPELTQALVAATGDSRPFKLVSNLPYGAGTTVMAILATDYPSCSGMFVTIQREVADRLTAQPGSKDYGPISVLMLAAAEISVIAQLPPECFWPRPEVRSTMLAIQRQPRPLTADLRGLFDFTQGAFEQRRKQLGSVLGRDRAWPPGIEPTMRAEQLTPHQFVSLLNTAEPQGR